MLNGESRAYLVETYVGPRALTLTPSALIDYVAIFVYIGMERQWACDIGRWHGHLERSPRLPTIVCPVVCRSASEYECLRQKRSAVGLDIYTSSDGTKSRLFRWSKLAKFRNHIGWA